MVHLRNLVIFASTFGVLASPLEKRDLQIIKDDLATISTDVNNLDNGISGFPNTGGSLTAALAIHNEALALDSAIKKGTTDVQINGRFGEADGTDILAIVKQIQPVIIHALNTVADKRPAFDNLPLGGVSSLVKSDLTTLNTDTTAFEFALANAVPEDLEDALAMIKKAIDAAFATALAKYASA